MFAQSPTSAQEGRSLSERLELAEQFTEGRPEGVNFEFWKGCLGHFKNFALSTCACHGEVLRRKLITSVIS